jgi:hypothetical protein
MNQFCKFKKKLLNDINIQNDNSFLNNIDLPLFMIKSRGCFFNYQAKINRSSMIFSRIIISKDWLKLLMRDSPRFFENRLNYMFLKFKRIEWFLFTWSVWLRKIIK